MYSQIGKIFTKTHDRYTLFRYIYPFVNRNSERIISRTNTLCLFCQPRGGSTWLAEILLNIKDSVLVDEPLWRGKMIAPFEKPDFYERKVPDISELNFFYNQHIPEKVSWPEAKDAFEKIIAGRTISIGLYNEQDLNRLKSGSFFITKFNYANLLMPWLIRQFKFNSILLTRHPCAVIASQLRLPAWMHIDPHLVKKNVDFPYSEYYFSALQKIGKIDSKEKYLAFIWALGFQNTAMSKDNNKRWLTVSYEALLTDFHHELNRIDQRFSFDLLEKSIDDKKPSKSTKPNSLPYLHNNEQLASWKNELSKKQIATILAVLDKFEISIYSEKLEPDYKLLYSMDKKP